MSLSKIKVTKGSFGNYIKLGIALKITRDGLKHFVARTAEDYHNDLFECISRGVKCTDCQTANLIDCPTVGICKRHCEFHASEEKRPKPCSKNVCNTIRDRIRNDHRRYCANVYEPSWINSNSKLWATVPFEVIKCFLPSTGYEDVKSIAELDFRGIIELIVNNRFYQRQLDEDLSKSGNIFIKALEISSVYENTLTLTIPDEVLQSFLDIFMQLLTDQKHIKDDKFAHKSSSLLQQLKIDELQLNSALIKETLIESTKTTRIKLPSQRTTNTQRQAVDAKRNALQIAQNLFQANSRKFKSISMKSILASEDLVSALKELENVTGIFHCNWKETSLATYHYGDDDDGNFPSTSKRKRNFSESVTYEDLSEDLQSDLVNLYRKRHRTLPLAPLVEKNKVPLLEFYVPPFIRIVGKDMGFLDNRVYPRYTDVDSLTEIFKKEGKQCNNIYLTSDPGAGKTSFVKHLTLTWCQAIRPEDDMQHFFPRKDDLEEMKNFTFLFFISLCEAKRECKVDTMIHDLLLSQLDSEANYISSNIIQEVLHREKCLIILDGLDEWKHPKQSIKDCREESSEVPHRNIREHCTTLTTTRTWAVDTMRKDKTDIDQLLEMPGLGKESSEKLIANVINHLNKHHSYSGEERNISEFLKMIESKGLKKFESIAVMLMQLLCLWYDGVEPGEYQCQIYANMLEFLFRRAEATRRLRRKTNQKSKRKIPNCLLQNELCSKYSKLLLSLGKLAFSTLFDKDEPLHVFDQDEAKLVSSDLHICLKTGILCQTENIDKLSSDKPNIFFLHKTFQEFFAALHVYASEGNYTEMINLLTKRYVSVKQILSLETLLVFISGFSKLHISKITNTVNEFINQDPVTQDYRTNVGAIFLESNVPISSLCNMIVKCVMESKYSTTDAVERIYLEDIVIDQECTDKKYADALEDCISWNSRDIKSLSIQVKQKIPEDEVHELIHKLNMNVLRSLQKLFVWGEIPRTVLRTLLEQSKQTITCLELWSIKLEFEDISILAKMSNLQRLSFLSIKMSHEIIEELANTVIHGYASLKQLHWNDIECLDHSENCPGYILQLSDEAKPHLLYLDKVHVTKIILNAEQLNLCLAEWIYKSNALQSLLQCMQNAKRLERFDCDRPASADDRDSLVQLVKSLPSLRYLRLRNLDFDNVYIGFDFSLLRGIKTLHVDGVKMMSTAIYSMLLQFRPVQDSLVVRLENLQIPEEESYEELKAKLKAKFKDIVVEKVGKNLILHVVIYPKVTDENKAVTPAEAIGWDTYLQCIDLGQYDETKAIAEQLLQRGKLPDKNQLNNLHINRPDITLIVCNRICERIKCEFNNDIDHVWPAYRCDRPREVVFVVETKTSTKLKLDISYDYVLKVADIFSDEGYTVMKLRQFQNNISVDDITELDQCINKNAHLLMKNHKHLSVMDGSSVRSKGFNENNHQLIPELCIVLYVRRKGFIPVGEDPFKPHYDGKTVDVREGVFYLQGQLKMGCQIASDHHRIAMTPSREGTLGGFLDHPKFGLCGLTSAHVLLHECQMKEIIDKGGTIVWPYFGDHDSVYLNHVGSHKIGRLVQVICDGGNEHQAGMEVAIFQIDAEHPKFGEFSGIAQDNALYNSGKVQGLSRFSDENWVYKVGATSGLTHGTVYKNQKLSQIKLKTHDGCIIGLCNQLMVHGKSLDGSDCKFSDGGDSGSIVMMRSADGESACIGILTGAFNVGGDGNILISVITPILPILEKLNIVSLKNFKHNELECRLDRIENKIDLLISKLSH